MMKYKTIAVAITTFFFLPALAAQDVWNIDTSHSSIQFQVKHLMISDVRGEFRKMSGQILFDGKGYSTVKADVVIQVASIDTRESKRDEHLRSADFFDAARYPTIIFKSKRVEGISERKFNLVGDLTMRGVTKEVTLDVEATHAIKGMQGETRIGAQATALLNRQDYGIKWNRALDAGGVVVSDEVRIILNLELVRQD
jgi:polyisoprenoid-binding protein YceI